MDHTGVERDLARLREYEKEAKRLYGINPEAFQENYQVLRRLDGSLPADGERDYEACYLAWNDCPALQALPLGEYTETVLGQEIHGDSQKRLSSLFVARRGFWTSRTAEYADECDALWIAMTGGSSR